MTSSFSLLSLTSPLNIQYKGKNVKKYSEVTYLGCVFDKPLSEESMATHVINEEILKIKISLSTKRVFRYSPT